MTVSISLASDAADIEAARDLCHQWLDWHWAHYPSDWPVEGNPMERKRFADILANLSNLHARPKGAIFLAFIDDKPVGCVM